MNIIDQDMKYNLTSYQRDIWLKQKMNNHEPLCNIGARVEIDGFINYEILNKAINKTIQENDALRIHISDDGENPTIEFYSDIHYSLPYYDFSQKSNPEEYSRSWSQKKLLRLLNLNSELFEFALIKVGKKKFHLFLKAHHIIVDGWGLTLVGQRISENYNLIFNDGGERKNGYGSFTHLMEIDRKYVGSLSYFKDIEFWKDIYRTLPEPLFSIKESMYSENSGITSDRAKCNISRHVYDEIESYCKMHNCTAYHFFLGILAIYFCRLYDRDEMVIGIPVLNRGKSERDIIGHCVNLVPLRIRVKRSDTFTQFMIYVRNELRQCYRHYRLPYGVIYRELGLHRKNFISGSLYDIILSFDVHNVKLEFHDSVAKSYVLSHQHEHQALFALVNSATPDEDVTVYFDYMLQIFNKLFPIQRFISHFEVVLRESIKNTESEIKNIDILDSEEINRMVLEWNDTEIHHDSYPCLHALFEAQSLKTPHNVAVLCNNKYLTYKELNERSNKLARYLFKKGIVSQTLVGILMDRSIEMIVGLFAVLKSGGAYVPFDVNAPSSRLSYMIQDSGIKILLTHRPFILSHENSKVINVSFSREWSEIDKESSENMNLDIDPNQISYIIYTSGTTGKPKGVIISHGGAVNTILDINSRLGVTAIDHILSLSSICFDLSVYDIFGVLATGAAVILPRNDEIKSPSAWLKYITFYQIRIWNSVPQLMQMLVDYTEESDANFELKHVLMSGDWIPVSLPGRIKRISPSADVYSLGGATEASIWSIIYPIGKVDSTWKSIPYGKPLANQKFYVLNSDLMPLPISIPGDLYISGKGVALGYLNQPQLTEEKFVIDPFSKNETSIMYKTGDLGRYLPDGNIEFIGRSDNQVKIRGYRIEIGEIESVIHQMEFIQDSVVMVKDDHNGNKRLISYFVTDGRKVDTERIKKTISRHLPDYMVPSQFIQLEAFPLTDNGKVDRNALPEPEYNITKEEYSTPNSDVEKFLCEIYQEVLGIENIGVNDNFFEIGGDSILAIQIISRASRKGIEINTRQIYEHQTISEISLHVKYKKSSYNEDISVEGDQLLLPAQYQFLTEYCGNLNHFNQSILIDLPENVTEEKLRKALLAVEKRHDVFRLRFKKKENDIKAYYLHSDMNEPNIVLGIKDLKNLDSNALYSQIKNDSDDAHKNMDIQDGPLSHVIWFCTGEKIKDQILWIIHHLIVDGVSWRILLNDFYSALSQLFHVKDVTLEPKTLSFKDWGKKIDVYSRSTDIEKEFYHWVNVLSTPVVPLPVDYSGIGEHLQESTEKEVVFLSSEMTGKLIKHGNRAYHTQINDLLLTALMECLSSFMDTDFIRIDLEGHGREELFSEIDISETVGWFTSIYPVGLKRMPGGTIGDQIRSVKEQIRKVPNKGIGYGILRYIKKSEAILPFDSRSEIVFNYLGQLDTSLALSDSFNTLMELMGKPVGDKNRREYRLGINGIIVNGVLEFIFDYDGREFKAETIRQLACGFIKKIEEVVIHCMVSAGGYTPSDFPIASLTQEQLNGISQKYTHIYDIYPATSMQEGLIFHSEMNPDSGVYMTQLSLSLQNISPKYFLESWKEVVDRHSILRTSFLREPDGKLLQIVQYETAVPWKEMDWRDYSEEFKADELKRLLVKERTTLFNLSQAPLMRCLLIQMSEIDYTFIWTHHHAIMDGWSMSILFQELIEIYRQLMSDNKKTLSPAPPYRNYVSFLLNQDIEKAKVFWHDYLSAVSSLTSIPNDRSAIAKTGEKHSEYVFSLSEDLTNQLNDLARRCHVTLNIVLQGAWALLLGKYNGEKDVVYGVTRSGRANSLQGIDSMVGLFLCSLPLHIRIPEKGTSLSNWLNNIQEYQRLHDEYSYLSLTEIQKLAKLPAGRTLFDILFVFENYPIEGIYSTLNSMEASEEIFKVSSIDVFEQINYSLGLTVSLGERIKLRILYQRQYFLPETIERLMRHIVHILEDMSKEDSSDISGISMLTDEEKKQILLNWNATSADFPVGFCLHQLFEKQALDTPSNIAVVFYDEKITYKSLSEKSNQLARYLVKRGICKGTIAGILMDRSVEMIIALFGVLKTGAAYVPLDIHAPEMRLFYMIEDSGASVVLTERKQMVSFGQASAIPVFLDEDCEKINEESSDPMDSLVTPADLAYVIYTSGTTGKPKGVMIKHESAVNTLFDINSRLRISETDHVLALSSICFDLSVYDIFGILGKGATVVLPKQEEIKTPSAWLHYIETYKIRVWNTVPQLMQMLVDYAEQDRKTFRIGHVLLSGDWIPLSLPDRIRKISPSVDIYSLGGATEASIWSIIFPIEKIDPSWRSIPYGRPLSNQKFYILDKDLAPCPVSIPGDLYISGKGVALGYLNRLELSREKFIPDPFSADSNFIMYKTGDLGQYMPDGNIEFIGRRDNQVKIRGYRIELGEIESVLNQMENVQDSAVLVKEDRQGNRRLVGYFVSTSCEMSEAYMKMEMSKVLPEYMIPANLIHMKIFPLTENGKVDRKTLQNMEDIEPKNSYISPKNSIEKILCEIWKEVIGREKVGVNDNFFEIGGDSILAIQVVSRSIQKGINFTIRQLFDHQTIRDLSYHVERKDKNSETDELIHGMQVLLPAQKRFLSLPLENHNYYNQSVLIELPHGTSMDMLEQVIYAIECHHDVFRLRFFMENGEYLSRYEEIENDKIQSIIEIEDIRHSQIGDLSLWIEERANTLHAGLNLSMGPLSRMLLIRTDDEKNDMLLWIMHHMIVDGVSWRILHEDLNKGLLERLQGKTISRGYKSTSFRNWGLFLSGYSESNALDEERMFWTDILSHEVVKIPRDHYVLDCLNHSETKKLTVYLDSSMTDSLLHKVNQCYRTQINDILLTALVLSLTHWMKSDSVRVDLEGHGREEFSSEMNLGRTVGWFTSIYPIILRKSQTISIRDQIIEIKESLRNIPNKGMGYGLLKYMRKDPLINSFDTESEISFNYLGQIGGLASSIEDFKNILDSTGWNIDVENQREYSLAINALILDFKLQLTFDYSSKEFEKTTVEEIASSYKRVIEDIIHHCLNEKGSFTPSDFPLSRLNQRQIDEIQEQYPMMSDIYVSTSMQRGMLFHTEMEPDSGVYMTQFCMKFHQLNPHVFHKSWKIMSERHSVFRTAFVQIDDSDLYQLLSEKVNLPWMDLDWSNLSEMEQNIRLENLTKMERHTPFVISRAPLMRCVLIRQSETDFRFLWTHHHALLDGWCLPLLLNELFTIYKSLIASKDVSLAPALPYRNYMSWLNQQNKEEASNFWKEYLRGFEEPNLLPKERYMQVTDAEENFEYIFHLNEVFTRDVILLAQKCKVTINTVLQASWAILLSQYSGDSDVIFGCTRSGRSIPLSHVESIIGLFINTLPIRVQFSSDDTTIEKFMRDLQDSQKFHDQYGYLSLLEIQKLSEVPRDRSLFETLFVFENYPMDQASSFLDNGHISSDSIQLSDFEAFEKINYPIGLTASLGKTLRLRFLYRNDRFSESAVIQMKDHLTQILKELVKDQYSYISQISMLTPVERHRNIVEWNDTKTLYPSEKCIHEIYEDEVEKNGNATALMTDGHFLSYQMLNKRANQLAHFLVSIGIKPGDHLGILLDRSMDMVTAILGILKSGGCYVPLDPVIPDDRLGFIIEDSHITFLLTHRKEVTRLSNITSRIVCMDEEHILDLISGYPDMNIEKEKIGLTPHHLAYIIYTSGSTGKPKGVMIEHRGLVNYVLWSIGQYVKDEKVRFALYSSISFDLTVTSVFTPLCSGNSVIIYKDTLIDQIVKDNKVHVLKLTPSHLRFIQKENCTGSVIKRFIVGGENLPSELAASIVSTFGEDIEIYNEYGPTETVVGCMIYRYDPMKDKRPSVPIGLPADNVQIYILDSRLRPVPVGIAGELFISGDGVGRGYINQKALTDQAFIDNPFIHGTRMYRTGDIARRLIDGNIEFIGRVDDQVKIRGYRIELGEIESVMNRMESVSDSLVVIYGEKSENQFLAAYYIRGEREISIPDMRSTLLQKLPEYMIPSFFFPLDEYPLTKNGKIDRKRLPKPDGSFARLSLYIAPETQDETVISDIWKAVLRIEKPGVNDNFFEMGGHSLLATKVISKMRKSFNRDFPLRMIFDNPTIRGLAEKIDQNQSSNEYHEINSCDRASDIPLSFAQSRLWFMDQYEEKNSFYNVPCVIQLDGFLNAKVLESAFLEIISRHEVLRTNFKMTDDNPCQVIHSQLDWKIEIVDLTIFPDDDRVSKAIEIIVDRYKKPFCLEKDWLMQACLYKINDDTHILFINMHHIVSDAWSLHILLNELSVFYNSFVDCKPSSLEKLSIQYADFAVWQRNNFHTDRMDQQMEYWKKQLMDTPRLEIPTDFCRPARQTFNGRIFSFHIDASLSGALNSLSKEKDATLFMTLLSAFNVLLYKYTGQTDICIGSPIANRNRGEIEPLIGFFVNTLALRSDMVKNSSFTEFLNQVKHTTLAAYEHQDVPFEKIVDCLNIDRNLAFSPIFQVMFVFQNTEELTLGLSGLNAKGVQIPMHTSKFDMTVAMTEKENGIWGEIEYNTDIFKEDTIVKLSVHFKNLLESILRNPEMKVFDLEFLISEEKKYQLQVLNNTQRRFTEIKCIHQLFEEQAYIVPDNIAVVFENRSLTYRALNTQSNQLACYLRENWVGPEFLVGLSFDRSIDMVIAILGVLKAGGAYVPLDPNYPADRLRYMIEDSEISMILTHRKIVGKLPVTSQTVYCLDDEIFKSELGTQKTDNIDTELMGLTPDNLSYVIYTSGSTGKPKGVMLTHKGLFNLSIAQSLAFHVESGSRVLQFASLNFDAATSEWCMALTTGATLYLFPQAVIQSADQLSKAVRKHQLTHATLPPALLPVLDPEEWRSVKDLVVAGESCSLELSQKWTEGRRFYNAYGPTETTVCATIAAYETMPSRKLSIGRPILNTSVCILDENLNLLNIGAVGELCISGIGLARGYLNNPDLTHEKFISHPFTRNSQDRLYRSGDLARWLPDGTLEFIGRLDQQVKIRGFRIELGEIESVVRLHKNVEDVTVVVREGENKDKRIICYIVSDGRDNVTALEDEIRLMVKAKLPAYMIPSAFIFIKEIPLTKNGKIDRNALPWTDCIRNESLYMAPRNHKEKTLCEIFQSILNIDKVGIHDNFFEVGGDSILAIQAVSRAKRSGFKFSLRDLFERQTVSGIISHNKKERTDTDTHAPSAGHQILLPIQKRFLSYSQDGIHHYNQSALIALPFILNENTVMDIVKAIENRHDIFRLRIDMSGGNIDARYADFKGDDIYSVMAFCDLRQTDLKDLESEMERMANITQKSMNISDGPISRLVYFKMPQGEQDQLLWVIHHLIVDGVSWRILMADFIHAFEKIERGDKVFWGSKTISYQKWGKLLWDLSESDALKEEEAFWIKTCSQEIASLTFDTLTHPETTYRTAGEITALLEEKTTQQLLKEANGAYHTQTEELLLTALIISLSEWMKTDLIRIDLEGHGREPFFSDTDLGETVGWFTSIYPVMLRRISRDDIGSEIQSIRDQIRNIPNRGMGYGILRYLKNLPELNVSKNHSEVLFNYLGQFDSSIPDLFRSKYRSTGRNIGEENMLDHRLNINCMIYEGCMQLGIEYSRLEFESHTIQYFSDLFIANVRELVFHCLSVKSEKSSAACVVSPLLYGKCDSHEKWTPVLSIQEQGSQIPVFCLAGAGGNVICYHPLSKALGNDQPVYGLQYAGIEECTRPLESIREIAKENIMAIRSIQKEGPYYLIGHSFGGFVAFEMAVQLQKEGDEIGFLGILDQPQLIVEPGKKYDHIPQNDIEWMNHIVRIVEEFLNINTGISYEEIERLSKNECIELLRDRINDNENLDAYFDADDLIRMLDIYKIQMQMSYVPEESIYHLPVHIYASEENANSEAFHEWDSLLAVKPVITFIPGGHISMLNRPNVKILAEYIKRDIKIVNFEKRLRRVVGK